MKKNIARNLPKIKADHDRMLQVLINLISNAVKFTPEGEIICDARVKGEKLEVSVKDSGIGIAKEDHSRVFEKFKQIGDTLTNKPQGTGLGLPICKEIIKGHQGEIWVESQLGEGSRFCFNVPYIKRKEEDKKKDEDAIK